MASAPAGCGLTAQTRSDDVPAIPAREARAARPGQRSEGSPSRPEKRGQPVPAREARAARAGWVPDVWARAGWVPDGHGADIARADGLGGKYGVNYGHKTEGDPGTGGRRNVNCRDRTEGDPGTGGKLAAAIAICHLHTYVYL